MLLMKIILGFIFTSCLVTNIYGQKPALTIEDTKSFPEIGATEISNDGKYLWYKIVYANGSTLILSSTDNSYRKEINGLPRNFGNACFTEDSRRFIYLKPGDTLSIFDVNSEKEQFIPNCRSYKVPDRGNGNWLAYQRTDATLILYNLSNYQNRQYPQIVEYTFTPNCHSIVLRQNMDSATRNNILWVTLDNFSTQTIWTGDNVNNLTFSNSGTKIAFISTASNENGRHDIWYHDNENKKTEKIVYDGISGINPTMKIALGSLQFSNSGNKLFFYVEKKDSQRKTALNLSNVEIWNYKDQVLQPEQSLELNRKMYFSSVVHLSNKKIVQLTDETDKYFFLSSTEGENRFLCKTMIVDNVDESNSGKKDTSMMLVNTDDGSQRLIVNGYYDTRISPEEKYVYWYNNKTNIYYSYNIQTGSIKSISEKIPTPLYDESFIKGVPNALPYGSTFWLPGDKALFIYDKYDIWQVDPKGHRNPICITNGYGRKQHLVFRLPYNRLSLNGADYIPIFKTGRIIHLNAFDETTKDNGFFSLQYGANKNPEKLTMSPDYYYYSEMYTSIYFNLFLIKAKKADVFLLKKENASIFPNLQITKDFKRFTQISALAPQKRFNWLTSQLMSWRAFDGTLSQAILYKPENFDSTKRYPVILYFYERLSDGLNKFPNPEIGTAPMALNIPYFVSQGYLVFCPDIYYTQNHPGESVYNYVVSAVEMLNKKQYVDSTKIGMQGQSFGGFEVNYLITRTHLFAAAASSAGNSNLLTTAGSLIDNTNDGHLHIQRGQYRIKPSIWDSLNLWINNSPVFNADKVSTPLLIIHGKGDTRVPWLQGVEFYTSLRLLTKKVWLLSYVDGDHCTLFNERDQSDCVIRMNQFFDHYLKSKPAPIWMTQGVPATLKGIETGYELDPSGNCGRDCRICLQWNIKFKKDSTGVMEQIREIIVH